MSNQLVSLESLAVQINALDDQANYHAGQAVIYAAKCGEKLLLAKAQCKHGEFKDWLSANSKVSYSVASRYMKISTEMPNLLSPNVATSALLPSVSQAIELLSASDEVKEEVTKRIEEGENVTVKEIQRLKKLSADLERKLNEQVDHAEGLEEDLTVALDEKKLAERVLNDLQKNQQTIIEAKAAEAKAQAILDAQSEIQRVKSELNALQEKNAKLKKEHEKELGHKVNQELQKHKTEIDQRQYQISQLEKHIQELQATQAELDNKVGALKTHKTAIDEIKTALLHIKSQVLFCKETKKIPVEVLNDWQFINEALAQLQNETANWIDSENIFDAEILDVVSWKGNEPEQNQNPCCNECGAVLMNWELDQIGDRCGKCADVSYRRPVL